ncbi:hypothetical protein BAE44_0009672 [Dichanthelium oligosanthes]|uniref:Uncharacterized protein n=1 Tax=Dichanthelium oligosanthes TaxID=888268 RepID=A0A1E5VW03_9POAL|nr:hypothetical protein BAE44_0009672 [Dichanthelium oligosanthes]
MAELTFGAVSSLLGLLQKEAQLLSGVGSDVDFIREEMESMNSFLEHLSRAAHLAGGHDKQVRTWMKQVRDLAHDCSNCIDSYLQSGDLAVHLARGGLRRYVWWTYWLVHKMVAQHRAAMRLSELKDRVSDLGKRRQRYGVEIPGKAAAAQIPPSSSTPPSQQGAAAAPPEAAAQDEDDDDTENRVAAAGGGPDPPRRALEPRILEDFRAEKLVTWFSSSSQQQRAGQREAGRCSIPSIAIVAQDADTSAAAAQGALDLAAAHFEKRVSVNLQALHYSWDLPLLPQEILCYILRECIHQGTCCQGEAEENQWKALEHRDKTYEEIWENIDKFSIYDKINQVKSKIIGEVRSRTIAEAERNKTEETKRWKATAGIPFANPLEVFVQALRLTLKEEGPEIRRRSLQETVQVAARMLKQLMEEAVPGLPIQLDDIQYQDILRKVFLDSKFPQAQETSTNTATALGEDHIKEILNNHKITLDNHKIALDIIRKLLPRLQLPEGSSVMEQATTETEKMDNSSWDTKANSTTAAIKETLEKVEEILWPVNIALLIKGIVDKINDLLQSKKTLIILIDDSDYISQWEEIRNALSLLACAHGSAVIVITKNSQNAKEFCSGPGEPITYSLVGMYHDTVLKITSQGENEGGNKNSEIFRDILEKCDPDEFCMRIFSCALYANPNRSDEELRRLNGTLQAALENSVMASDATTKAKILLKFSYKDLPREHKTCLLYLAIFPKCHSIKRSTLIERWAIEGLITKEDWPTVVRHAKRCFEALIDRGLVMPVDLSAEGKVKSCMVGDPVHEFITKIANKEHILDTRLSQLHARHFSTFSGLRLRASDSIDTIVQKLRPKYLHKLRVLKLLDLEGCYCLDKNHLKDICSTILRLKYLSIRGTDVDDLPSEINNLRELEVLDIRQTKVPERATRGIMLLKLRRLLADQIVDPSRRSTSQEMGTLPGVNKRLLRSAVQIPRKINKMENMEVLSNVKASSRDGAELKEIRKLGQLRKLGVVIDNKKAHLKNLLWAISDLKECLQSLSITILGTTSEGTPTEPNLLPYPLYKHLIQPPKVLESLSIDGFTDIVRLLTLFARGSHELAKVTLSRTLLEKKNLIHITMLPKLHCIRLRHDAYKESILAFEKEEFPHLKNFLVECLHKTDIINFKNGATPELEKIVLSHTNIRHLCGVGALPKLKELELKGNKLLVLLPEDETASAKPVKHEYGTASAEPVKPEDGAASAEAITKSRFTFKKEEFKHLEYFLVQGPIVQTVIEFEGGAPELKKIVLSETNIESLVGVNGLGKLREIDLKGNRTLLSLFASANHITKVTLSDTRLKRYDLQTLAEKPKLRMLVLLDNSYDEIQLAFHEDEFPKLKHLIVKCQEISEMSFAEKSACKLEKIIWSFKELKSLSGIDKLPELKELEFNGDSLPLQVRRDIHAHHKKYIHNKPQHQEKEEGSAPAKKKSAFFSILHPFATGSQDS